MKRIVAVSFKNSKYLTYFDANEIEVKIGDKVIVNTERGLEFGTIEIPNFTTDKNKSETILQKVIRVANKNDHEIYKKNSNDELKALKKCRDLVEKMNLDMQIIDASFTFDRNQLLFRFLSDSRVDFRKLAKELANCYKTRIELRQLGVRDKAKEVGGCGLCGLTLCCTRFNCDFASVSINMAKNQNISLNPNKINGACGRLLCCLRYEDEMYKQNKKTLPKIGEMVETEQGKGKVESVDVLNQKCIINIQNVGQVEIDYGSN